MPKCLCLIVVLILSASLARAQISENKIPEIAQAIADEIITGEPIILDIRAGEWSQALATQIKRQLLEKDADIREATPKSHSPAFSDPETELDFEEYDLSQLHVGKALLVLVEMELRWHTIEHKTFLSYNSQRKPAYIFNIKQISLPSQRLLQINAINWELNTKETRKSSPPSTKWYEPLLVTTALASIIYLLWTTE